MPIRLLYFRAIARRLSGFLLLAICSSPLQARDAFVVISGGGDPNGPPPPELQGARVFEPLTPEQAQANKAEAERKRRAFEERWSGATAPDFLVQDLAGADVRLSDFRGKTVVLDFWATWCGPCLAALPHLQELAAHYKDQDVVVLGVSTRDKRAHFEKFVKTNQGKYADIRWVHDKAEDGAGDISKELYGLSGIPVTFVIDRTGKVVGAAQGYLPGERIVDAILAEAGIKVDPAIVAKGEADRKAREQ
jgi:thiol-disulfide isomerase/thioredoxin